MKMLIKKIFRKLKKMLSVKLFFAKIKNIFFVMNFFKKYKDYTVIWTYPHIGDVFISMPFIHEFKKINNKKIVLVGNVKLEYLYKLFDNSLDIDVYDLLDSNEVMRFSYNNNFFFINRFILKKIKRQKYIDNEFYFMQKYFPINKNEGVFNYTKRVIYGLDENAKIELPKIETKKSLSEKKYIIISPYAQSVKQIDLKEYSNLVETLKEKGYEVYTNAHGDEKEIEGTKKLDCSLIELCEYANSAEAFIGLRSGICDMLAVLTNVKMFVLFNIYSVFYFFLLSEMRENDSTISEYFGTEYQTYFNDIILKLEKK